MSGLSAPRLVNFSGLTLSLKNELNHLIPTSDQSDEDTDDYFPLVRYTIQAGDICLVRANSGLGKTYACVFVTKCSLVHDDEDDEEARVVFDNDRVLHMLDSVMIFRIDAHGFVRHVSNQHDVNLANATSKKPSKKWKTNN